MLELLITFLIILGLIFIPYFLGMFYIFLFKKTTIFIIYNQSLNKQLYAWSTGIVLIIISSSIILIFSILYNIVKYLISQRMI